MLKAKRLKSMFVLYSACAVMATGFTSQAASEQPEVTTITETKGENTNTHTAVQAISQNIVASAQEMTDASQQVIADNVAKKEEEERLAREKAEQEAKEKAEREKAKMEAQVEKLKQQQKEKEQRQTSISDSELKRINSIAKLEQSLSLLENNFDVLKNNKAIIRNDAELKIRVEILKNRLVDLIENL